MEREVLLTGIGGQGVQLAAQVLARAATLEDRYVMMLGVYGGTMRGGNTDSTVLISHEPISSPPIVAHAWAGLGMHPRYWGPVAAKLRTDGWAAIDADLFEETPSCGSAHVLTLPATGIAKELGAPLSASLVLLGAFARAADLVGVESLVAAMEQSLPPYRRQHAEANARALHAGFEAGASHAWGDRDHREAAS